MRLQRRARLCERFRPRRGRPCLRGDKEIRGIRPCGGCRRTCKETRRQRARGARLFRRHRRAGERRQTLYGGQIPSRRRQTGKTLHGRQGALPARCAHMQPQLRVLFRGAGQVQRRTRADVLRSRKTRSRLSCGALWNATQPRSRLFRRRTAYELAGRQRPCRLCAQHRERTRQVFQIHADDQRYACRRRSYRLLQPRDEQRRYEP